MDAITRISYYFPTHTLTIFQIISNLVINDSGFCTDQDRSLVIAIVVLFSLACFMVSFTDTYAATNGNKYWVLLLPGYGPVCFSLPTDYDKDRVYDFYYIKIRDYVHALLATTCFILVALFCNPVCMCLFPSGKKDGTSRFDASIVRTVPIVVSLICGMLMVCLGPPRQMMGYQNVPEAIPPPERANTNPMFTAGGSMGQPSVIEEGEEDGYSQGGPPMDSRASMGPKGGDPYGGGKGGSPGDYPPPLSSGRDSQRGLSVPPRESYTSNSYRQRDQHTPPGVRTSQRLPPPDYDQ